MATSLFHVFDTPSGVNPHWHDDTARTIYPTYLRYDNNDGSPTLCAVWEKSGKLELYGMTKRGDYNIPPAVEYDVTPVQCDAVTGQLIMDRVWAISKNLYAQEQSDGTGDRDGLEVYSAGLAV